MSTEKGILAALEAYGVKLADVNLHAIARAMNVKPPHVVTPDVPGYSPHAAMMILENEKGERVYGLNQSALSDDATTAHELGHLKTHTWLDQNAPALGHLFQKARLGETGQLITGITAAIVAATLRDPSWAPSLVALAVGAPTLTDEAMATGHATKYLIKEHGTINGLRKTAPLLGHLAGYVAGITGASPAITGFRKLADVATPLKKHQQRVVDRLKDPDQPGLVAMHGLGSGKTLTSIAAADALGMPADVALPAALRANFQKELKKHAPKRTPKTQIQSLENLARNQTKLHNPFLIVDEAHRSRNPTKTQQALQNNEAKKRLLLTGSLFYNHPSDAAGPVNLVAGANVLPSDPDEFKRRFIYEREEHPSLIGKLLGAQPHLEQGINSEEKGYLRDVLKKYVDYHPGSTEDFPTRTDETIGVPMSGRQKEIYDTLLGKAPPWVHERVRSGLPPRKSEMAQLNRFLQGTRQVSNSTAPYHLDRPSEQPKVDRAVHELNELLSKNPRAKALVFSNYLDAGINPYKAQLDKLQIPYGEFTGAMPHAQRNQMVKDYNANKLRALLLSRAGGEGLDLKGTRLIQLLEPGWNQESQKQMIGRGIRYKSHADLPEEERNVAVQRFVSQNPRRGLAQRLHFKNPERSVDQYLLGLAQRKEDLNEKFRELLAEGQQS